MGKTPTFQEKGSNEKEDSDKKEKSAKPIQTESNCTKCEKKCNYNKFDFAMHGLFEDESSVEEDDSEVYICEFCTALGYGKKYKPDLCDNCIQCESCSQYLDECSGCGYSRWRDGTYYRDKLPEEELFSQEDLDIFRSIELDKTGGERIERSHFKLSDL